MMEMNSTTMSIAAIVIGLLVCYYIWKEVKHTQSEVNELRAFSGKVASYIENTAAPMRQEAVAPVAPTQCAKGQCKVAPEPIPEEDEEITE
jgi:hypothetical protein